MERPSRRAEVRCSLDMEAPTVAAVRPAQQLERDRLLDNAEAGLTELQSRFGLQAIQLLPQAEALEIRYPVEQYVAKPQSANLDKDPVLEGTLLGIKGQYLLLDTAVINIRKYTAYHVAMSAH